MKPVKSPQDMLADIGRTLYGDHWRLPLARGVGINDETIRRWMRGRSMLPADHGVFDNALRLIERRQSALAEIREKLIQWRNKTNEGRPD